MTCLHNHDQILEFLRKIFLKGFQIDQNYLCAFIHCKHHDLQQMYKCDQRRIQWVDEFIIIIILCIYLCIISFYLFILIACD